MTTLTLRRPFRSQKTWLGSAVLWPLVVPPVVVGGYTLVKSRTRWMSSEMVSLTREDLGLDRQAHPETAITAGLTQGYRPCHPQLADHIARTVQIQNSRYLIMVIEGLSPQIYYAPGGKSKLEPKLVPLEAVRFVQFSVIMTRP